MKIYRAIMEWRYYDDHFGIDIWRKTTSEWYLKRETAEICLEELRGIRTKLILDNSEENTTIPPDHDEAFFDEYCLVEFQALRIEEIEIYENYKPIKFNL